MTMNEPTLQELAQQIKALEELRYAKSRALVLQHIHDIKSTLDIKGTTVVNGTALEIPLPEYGETLLLSVDSSPHYLNEEPTYIFEGPGVTAQYVSDILEGFECLAGRAEHKVREAQEELKAAQDLLRAYTALRDQARAKLPPTIEPIEALFAKDPE